MSDLEKKEQTTEETNNSIETILLTEAEFEKKQRAKTKENINRVTRVFGIFAILLLAYVGLFDPLFELSFFGAVFDNEAFKQAWYVLGHNERWIGNYDISQFAGFQLNIFDDRLMFGSWLPQLGMTIVLFGIAILVVYLITYTVVDFVDFFKSIFAMGRDITKDLGENVKDGIIKDGKTLSTSTKNFITKLQEKKNSLIQPKEPKQEIKRRSEENQFSDLSSEQIDALLSGANIEDVVGKEDDSNKKLFLDSIDTTEAEKKLFP